MSQLSAEVETRINMSRLSVAKRELMRDFLTAAVAADSAVIVKAGDDRWAAIDIFRSGQSVGRVYTQSGKILINNFVPGSKSGDYGPDVPLGVKGEWWYVLKREDDVDLILRCLADNIAHLGGRRVRPDTGQSRPIGAAAPRATEGARRTLSRAVRFTVLVRDNYTCQYCGRRAPEVVLHVDHRKPVSLGGGDEVENLLTACVDCNLGKSNRHTT